MNKSQGKRIAVILSDDEKREIEAAAAAISLPASAYIRMVTLRAARNE